MAVAVGWLLLQTLNVRPWVEQHPVENVEGEGALPVPDKGWSRVFLAVATSLFALLGHRLLHARCGREDWTAWPFRGCCSEHGVLILSSVAINEADCARRGQWTAWATCSSRSVFVLFLAGQLWAWQQLNASGHFWRLSAAAFFICPAGAGASCWAASGSGARTTAKVWRGVAVGDHTLGVGSCACTGLPAPGMVVLVCFAVEYIKDDCD
jgi:cytochrome c oxidase subunit 3